MQVIVDGLLANYSKQGEGKKILLLHGWGDSIRGLSPFIMQLSKNYQVLAVDLPGFGDTQPPNEAWGLNRYADFVKAFTTKINYSPDIIIGHSNGGAIAIRGLTSGLTADKLVLIGSAGIRGEYKGRIKIIRYLTKIAKLITKLLPAGAQKRLRQKFYGAIGSDMLVAEHLQDSFKLIINDDVREDAGVIDVKSLLIYGDQDTSTPLKYGQLLKSKIKNSNLIVVKGGSHWLPTENTQQIVKLIKEFVK
ncbi:alpha/beta hydrolase [Candidatus Saccharibacteria bacterium]|nr:alpha/beta hydrolase [Candidatus Saccharibacteria bacterium]